MNNNKLPGLRECNVEGLELDFLELFVVVSTLFSTETFMRSFVYYLLHKGCPSF